MTHIATTKTMLATQVQRQDLIDSMLEGKEICIRNVHGKVGNTAMGVVNVIEHEDGSGRSFNITLGNQRVYIKAVDEPRVFGLNHVRERTEIPYSDLAPSRQELVDSFLEKKPIIGKCVVHGASIVLAGIVTRIQREDGSGHSFNIHINKIPAYVKTRD